MTRELRGLRLLPSTAVAVCAFFGAANNAWSQNVEALLKNGPDSAKKIVAIIGDGYTNADLSQYANDVQAMIIDGAFAQDEVFRKNHTAFNIYRIDAISDESGVSQRVYDENGTPNDGSDDTIVSTDLKDTALGYIYSGSWAHCWMEPGTNTNTLIDNLLAATVPNADYVFIILNEPGWGGCGGGGRQVFTSGMPWTVVPHEMGHGIGGLHDEYTTSEDWTGGTYNAKNCSTVLDREDVVWADLIDAATPLPTVYNAGTMDIDDTVGMFLGCRTKDSGIYRPVQNCRMNSGNNQFCPVCERLIDAILQPFVDTASDYVSFVRWPGAACKPVNGSPITYGSDATARNLETTPVTLTCPARRVHINGVANRAFAHAWVIDRHPSEDACCHIESKNPGGETRLGGEECSSGSDTSYQTLRLDFPKLYDPYSWSHFTVECTLPGTSSGIYSRLITYRVGQQRY